MIVEGGIDGGMSWMEFVSAMFGHLAWPLAVVCLAVMFYRPIHAVITKVSEFEGLGFKASFREDVETLAVETSVAVSAATTRSQAELDPPGDADAAPPAPVELAVPAASDAWADMITTQPRLVVLESWFKIETAIRDALRRVNAPSNVSTPRALRILEAEGAISPSTLELVDNARRLRNRAVHSENDIQISEAALFASSAHSIAAAVRWDAFERPATATQ